MSLKALSQGTAPHLLGGGGGCNNASPIDHGLSSKPSGALSAGLSSIADGFVKSRSKQPAKGVNSALGKTTMVGNSVLLNSQSMQKTRAKAEEFKANPAAQQAAAKKRQAAAKELQNYPMGNAHNPQPGAAVPPSATQPLSRASQPGIRTRDDGLNNAHSQEPVSTPAAPPAHGDTTTPGDRNGVPPGAGGDEKASNNNGDGTSPGRGGGGINGGNGAPPGKGGDSAGDPEKSGDRPAAPNTTSTETTPDDPTKKQPEALETYQSDMGLSSSMMEDMQKAQMAMSMQSFMQQMNMANVANTVTQFQQTMAGMVSERNKAMDAAIQTIKS